MSLILGDFMLGDGTDSYIPVYLVNGFLQIGCLRMGYYRGEYQWVMYYGPMVPLESPLLPRITLMNIGAGRYRPCHILLDDRKITIKAHMHNMPCYITVHDKLTKDEVTKFKQSASAKDKRKEYAPYILERYVRRD